MKKSQVPCESNQYYQEHIKLLNTNFQNLLHRSLLPSECVQNLGREAFFADFALLSHNADHDPLFNYANQVALALFEFSWEELIGLPSRLSAEAGNQQAREEALTKVAEQGYMTHYNAVRISKTERRFRIQDVVIWNVHDEQGAYHGQAAVFKEWVWL
jgi:hypothetical protein